VHHIHTRNTYHTSFHQHAFVDQQNGHLVVETPAYTLQVPMLLVRHGQTDGNIKRQFQGQIDEVDHALNATGREQVRQGAENLYSGLQELFAGAFEHRAREGHLVILKSPLSRACDTAQAFIDHVAQHTGILLDTSIETRLSEMDFGIVEGRTLEDIAYDDELYEAALKYKAEDATIDWKGTGENYLDVIARAYALLEDLNARYAGKTVLVIAFSHGLTINAFRTIMHDPALVDGDGNVAYRRHVLKNAEVCWLGGSYHLAERMFRPSFE
jgi:broad specificity phosphatase PhoE